jgi:hypothetical protein
VRVTLSNFAITPSEDLTEGTRELRVVHDDVAHNHGDGGPGKTHDLLLFRDTAGGGRELVTRTGELKAGQSEDIAVQLTPGTYELECDVVEMVDGKPLSHVAEGMHRTITVS